MKGGQGGWLRLHRKLRQHARYRDSAYVHLWVHFLLSAEFKERPAIFNGKAILLKPGQFIGSRSALALATGMSEGTVARKISELKSDQQIDQRTSNKSSLFTVMNWKRYQADDQPEDQQTISKRSANDRPAISKTQHRKAGVHEKRPKKQRSLEAKGEGVGNQSLRFKPVPQNLFYNEYEALKRDALDAIEELKATPENVLRGDGLTLKAKEDIVWLEEEKARCPDHAEQLQAEIEGLKAKPESHLVEGFKPKVVEEIKAWRDRIKEIEKAMRGIEVNE